jgi:hypothetical protein
MRLADGGAAFRAGIPAAEESLMRGLTRFLEFSTNYQGSLDHSFWKSTATWELAKLGKLGARVRKGELKIARYFQKWE